MKPVFEYHQGSSPLLVSMPHSGLELSDGLAARMTPAGLQLADTDWHVPELYDFLDQFDASVIKANYSRYVVDLNRPPDGGALYPGKSETGLCPVVTFGGEQIYTDGALPDASETADRLSKYWRPYHTALSQAIKRLKDKFGYALLWDAHSIRSTVPMFFEGRLPDLNLGTAEDSSCKTQIADALRCVLSECSFAAVANGRFKGGYITRNYGRPKDGVHAVQMEIAQITYMSEAPEFRFDVHRAEQLRPVLRQLLETMVKHA